MNFRRFFNVADLVALRVDRPVVFEARHALLFRIVDDSLVYRYLPDRAAPDGLTGEEGTFSMCSFWYVECVGRSGDTDKARFLFEKMLGYANHLGLYGEELSQSGRHLGNFPQAFTHLALISAAVNLDRALEQRPRTDVGR